MRAKTEIGQGLIELRSRRSAAIGMRLVLVALLLGIAASAAVGQNMTHRLSYTPPQNTFRAGIDPSEDYSFNGFNASVQIYQFRPFSGNIVQTFQTTLLRDWIAPMHQEENVAGQPTFQKLEIPGAQLVVTASFAENIVGLPKPHMRMVIIAGSEAAIVDASAGTLQSWQMALPALNAMAGTLRVEAVRGPAPLTSSRGARCCRSLHGNETEIYGDHGQRDRLRLLHKRTAFLFVLCRWPRLQGIRQARRARGRHRAVRLRCCFEIRSRKLGPLHRGQRQTRHPNGRQCAGVGDHRRRSTRRRTNDQHRSL